MIEKIISRIKPKYITTDNYNLSEPKEKMKVRLYKNDENIAIIRLDDDERDGLWKYFLDTDIVEHDIADYILFKETCSEIICFIVELKKRKTKHNTNKANKQILSTLPIAKMIYEKSTNLNAKSLKVVGLKIFGTGNSEQRKSTSRDISIREEKPKEDELIAVCSFEQNINNQELPSLNTLHNDIKDILK